MLGFRLNKLGAAMRSGLDLRSLFGGGASGFLPKLDNADYDRQLYNAPATNAASAGDPIGLWLPSQSPADVTNLLLWTDAFDNAEWSKTGGAVTANVAIAPNGTPTADLFLADGAASQHFIANLTSDGAAAKTVSIYVKAGTAGFFQIAVGGTATPYANLNLTTGATQAFGTGTTATATDAGNGWWRVEMYTTDSAAVLTRFAIVSSLSSARLESFASSGSVYLWGAMSNLGSTALAYQPNAGCLGGSNRRTGGSNLLLWTQELSNSYYTPTSCTVTENTVAAPDGTTTADTLTEATGAGLLPRLPFGMTVEVGQTYTISIYAKETAGSKRYLQLYANAAFPSTSAGANFDLATGTASNVTSGYTAAAVSVGNGWWRCYVTTPAATGTSTGWRYALQDSASAAMAATYNPDGTGSMYLWGAQVNIGSLATYSRNMDQLGGLLLSAPLFQSTSANRGTLARRPASGIRNLQLYSTDMANTGGWFLDNSAFSSGVLSESATTTTHAAFTNNGVFTTLNATPYTFTTSLKKGSGATAPDIIQLTFRSAGHGGAQYANFNLLTGAVTASTGGVASVSVDPDATDHWLCSFTATSTAAAANSGGVIAFVNNNPTATRYAAAGSYLGVATSNVMVRATQLEAGSSFTGFQTVTSAADITESGQPDVWHTLWDGTSDFGTFGVQSFGSASLFADAGQAWTVWGWCRTLTKGITVGASKAGATLGNRTLQTITNASTGQLTVICRGTVTDLTTADFTDGNFHVFALRWNGTTLSVWVDRLSAQSATVGSAAEEAQNIIVSARTDGAGGLLPGHNDAAMIDRALSDAEMAQLMSNLNAVYRAGL